MKSDDFMKVIKFPGLLIIDTPSQFMVVRFGPNMVSKLKLYCFIIDGYYLCTEIFELL